MKNQSCLLTVAILSLFLAACGDKPFAESAAPAPAAAAPASEVPNAPAALEAAAPAADPVATVAAADPTVGKSVYSKTCKVCHGQGIAGAPKTGDTVTWAPRIAQGNDTLHKHAIEGFSGAKGVMPPRGGSSNLTDDEVKAAVDFMVAESK